MSPKLFPLLVTASLLWACSGRISEPKQPLADAEAAARSAREVGANSEPDAKLHAKLADEQIAKAKRLIEDGENERATYLTRRARADAELSLALAREQNAVVAKQKAVQQSQSTN